MRVLDQGTQLLRSGSFDVGVKDPLKSTLMAIRNGELDRPAIVSLGATLTKDLEEAYDHSVLPSAPNLDKLNSVLWRLRYHNW